MRQIINTKHIYSKVYRGCVETAFYSLYGSSVAVWLFGKALSWSQTSSELALASAQKCDRVYTGHEYVSQNPLFYKYKRGFLAQRCIPPGCLKRETSEQLKLQQNLLYRTNLLFDQNLSGCSRH